MSLPNNVPKSNHKGFFGFLRKAFRARLKTSTSSPASNHTQQAEPSTTPSSPTSQKTFFSSGSDSSGQASPPSSPPWSMSMIEESSESEDERLANTSHSSPKDYLICDESSSSGKLSTTETPNVNKNVETKNRHPTLDALALVISSPTPKHNSIGLNKLYEIVKQSKKRPGNDLEVRAIIIGQTVSSWRITPEDRLRESLLFFLCRRNNWSGPDFDDTIFSEASTHAYLQDEECHSAIAVVLEEEEDEEEKSEDRSYQTQSDYDDTIFSEASTYYDHLQDEDCQSVMAVVVEGEEEEELEGEGNTEDMPFRTQTDDKIEKIAQEEGPTWLELHLLALKIVARALDSFIHAESRREKTASSLCDKVNFQDNFWITILRTLQTNVKKDIIKNDDEGNVRIIGYSLKILRQLHSIDPIPMQQMFQQSLLPYLANLQCEAIRESYSLIDYETKRILKKDNVQPDYDG